MRDHLTSVLGVDPLSETGLARWTQTVIEVYREGIFITRED